MLIHAFLGVAATKVVGGPHDGSELTSEEEQAVWYGLTLSRNHLRFDVAARFDAATVRS